MKNKFLILAGLILAMSQPQTSRADHTGGHSEGNGGDAFVMDFTEYARAVQKFLTTRARDATPFIDAQAFLNVINTATMTSVDEVLYLNGIPKDVINYPKENKIVISRPRWKSVETYQKYAIATHEILWMMNIDDSKYEISSAILTQNGIPVDLSTEKDPRDDEPTYVNQWCTNVTGTLKAALADGYLASTAEVEKTILVTGINSSLKQGSARFQKLFVGTLTAALSDMQSYSGDTVRQVYLLRNYVQFALDDVSTFQLAGNNPNDNGPYVVLTLKHSLSYVDLSKTDLEEYNLLTRIIQRAVTLLDSSDFRRQPTYACARKSLSDALLQAADDDLPLKMKINALKSAVENTANTGLSCSIN